MPDTKTRVREHVHETPGVHFNRVSRDLDIATGQAQYHLRRLVRDGDLAVERIVGQTHYFDPQFDSWERAVIAFLRRETARGIIVRLHADGPARPVDLADDLDLARSTVSWHVSNLTERGVIEKSVDQPVTLSLTRPERTADLLNTVSPSLPNRIVDRFVRTVDSLLD